MRINDSFYVIIINPINIMLGLSLSLVTADVNFWKTLIWSDLQRNYFGIHSETERIFTIVTQKIDTLLVRIQCFGVISSPESSDTLTAAQGLASNEGHLPQGGRKAVQWAWLCMAIIQLTPSSALEHNFELESASEKNRD